MGFADDLSVTDPAPAPFVGQSPEPLWRELLGDQLRRTRLLRGLTLVEVAETAGVSPQYLSEIERGLKEPSSEMVAAITTALGLTLLDVTSSISAELATQVAGPAQGAVLALVA